MLHCYVFIIINVVLCGFLEVEFNRVREKKRMIRAAEMSGGFKATTLRGD